jgi:hypothetical protein
MFLVTSTWGLGRSFLPSKTLAILPEVFVGRFYLGLGLVFSPGSASSAFSAFCATYTMWRHLLNLTAMHYVFVG